MKNFFATTFFLFSLVFASAQDLLLSEDFDYPIGDYLNQHHWKPLTSATDNPIKIVNGLTKEGYSASGGAAYLNKNGQDVIRSFAPVSSDKIYISFQIDAKKLHNIGNSNYPSTFSPSSYFMFLSSKDAPTVPLLKFSLVKTQFAGTLWHLVVRDARNDIISVLGISPTTMDISFSYQLTGVGMGEAYLRSESSNYGAFHGNGLFPSKAKISNLGNIALSQSDINIGTECTIDRIRIGKTWGSVVPCISQFTYQDKFIANMEIWKYIEDGGVSSTNVNPNEFKKHEIIIKTCANQEVDFLKSNAYLHTKIGVDVVDLEVKVPNGFKSYTKYLSEQKYTYTETQNTLRTFYHYYDANNSLDILLLGNSDKISPNGNPITGSAGVYEGEISFTPVGGYCEKLVWKIKGIIENCPISFNVSVYPNITNGKLNLLINEKTPEGEIEVKLLDNLGNQLFQKNGNWEVIKPEVEKILRENKIRQYYFSVKQGIESKTIRLFREE